MFCKRVLSQTYQNFSYHLHLCGLKIRKLHNFSSWDFRKIKFHGVFFLLMKLIFQPHNCSSPVQKVIFAFCETGQTLHLMTNISAEERGLLSAQSSSFNLRGIFHQDQMRLAQADPQYWFLRKVLHDSFQLPPVAENSLS